LTDFETIIRRLSESQVECIVVGGLAGVVHGSSRLTQDIDLVYARRPADIARLVAALKPHSPYLRGAPPGLPFEWNEAAVGRGLNFMLTTDMGDIDLLGEITGGGDYDSLLPHSVEVELFGCRCRCLDLPGLIRTKRAAGRPRDLEALAELEALLEERERDSNE
jgi:predicted nucleotidyltransferase